MSVTLKHIQMTLDPESIENAILEIENFEMHLKPAMLELIRQLAEKGVEVARAELVFFDDPAYRTGALSESVQYKLNSDNAVLTAGEGLETEYGSYAMFVEYGTGIVGASAPHPEANGYDYDVNSHGAHGWYYPAPWGWVEAEDGTKLAWTQGMPSRPFMYNTMRDLEVEAKVAGGRIIAEYIAGC